MYNTETEQIYVPSNVDIFTIIHECLHHMGDYRLMGRGFDEGITSYIARFNYRGRATLWISF